MQRCERCENLLDTERRDGAREHSHEFHGQKFTETLIYGFYKGKMLFVEPMITKAFFETSPNMTKTIKQPQAYQRSGYYPTNYSISYDSVKQEYNVVIQDFVLRSGTTGVDQNDLTLPTIYSLSQNYPNPFNPSTTIIYLERVR